MDQGGDSICDFMAMPVPTSRCPSQPFAVLRSLRSWFVPLSPLLARAAATASVLGEGHGGGSHVTYVFAGSIVEREQWMAKKVTSHKTCVISFLLILGRCSPAPQLLEQHETRSLKRFN